MSNIRNENPAFEALTLGQIDESIEYGPLNMDSPIVSKEKNYKDMKKRIDTYRQYKEKGIVYKSPAVKEEYERLKKKAEAELN
ncbi:MAG: hypothetical protein CVV50_05455 [Spirochaetae bacterium HGW-Spirochaetae-6]|jgi:hypothetical protein|nr:MAG: hypothetical protein CVV50_05455 [Spirochaetae bacterium HGW-Spirochaetae-6]